MQRPNRTLVCGGKGSPAFQVCTSAGCTAHPCVCSDKSCPCQGPHTTHPKLDIEGFELLLRAPPALPRELREAEKQLNALTDSLSASVTHLKDLFAAKASAVISHNYTHNVLRQKLLAGQDTTATEMTGNNLCQMLDEIKNGRPVGNIQVMPMAQLQEATASALQKMKAIVQGVGAAWGLPVPSATEANTTLQSYVLSAQRTATMHPLTDSLVLERHFSKEWDLIGQVLLNYGQLHTLSLKDCDTGDAICEFVRMSSSLRRVCLGNFSIDSVNCGVTDVGVCQLTYNGDLT